MQIKIKDKEYSQTQIISSFILSGFVTGIGVDFEIASLIIPGIASMLAIYITAVIQNA